MEEAGSSMNNIVKTLMLLKDLEDYPKMRKTELEYYQKYAPMLVEDPPASTFMQVGSGQAGVPGGDRRGGGRLPRLAHRPGRMAPSYPSGRAGNTASLLPATSQLGGRSSAGARLWGGGSRRLRLKAACGAFASTRRRPAREESTGRADKKEGGPDRLADGGSVGLAGAYPDALLQVEDEDLAVAYVAGARRLHDGIDSRLHEGLIDRDLEFHFP